MNYMTFKKLEAPKNNVEQNCDINTNDTDMAILVTYGSEQLVAFGNTCTVIYTTRGMVRMHVHVWTCTRTLKGNCMR